MTTIDRLLTTREAEKALGIKTTKLYDLIKNNELPAVHIGRARRIRESEIGRFIERISNDGARS